MSQWIAIAALVLLTAAGLWRLKMPAAAVGGALALGIAGYLLAGRPGMPSVPAPPPAIDANAAPQMEAARERLLARSGDVGAWLVFSDALIRQGRSEDAIEGLRLATRAMPDSADLWVGLGNALVRHAGGLITPAARLAFGRASEIDPDHPGPPYFLGLAWLQAGEPDEALEVFEDLEKRSPPDAPWRPELERLIRGSKAMIAAGVDAGRFMPPQDEDSVPAPDTQ